MKVMRSFLARCRATLGGRVAAVCFGGLVLSLGMPLSPAVTRLAGGTEPIKASSTLSTYVQTPDPTYRWEVRERFHQHGCDVLRLHLQSQTWKGIAWKHILYLIRPESMPVDSDSGVLVITGGSWRADWPDNGPDTVSVRSEAQLMASVAQQFNCVIAVLTIVPFQPILGNKREDEIIATTFARYIETQDESWPLLLPMVKAAVRGMDATTEAAREHWGVEIERFTVTGASKRGWTTWLTGAVDPRATAIAPMVIDMLNLPEQMHHQLAAWGKYSEQIADYTELDLPRYLNTEAGRSLQAIVDPYSYRDQLTQAKLLIFGTNDRYWPVDACNLYWDGLRGDKYLLYVPNQGHGINDYARVIGSVLALHRSVNGGPPLPQLHWEFRRPDTGHVELDVEANGDVDTVRGWVATSATRDFREARWRQIVASRRSDSSWTVSTRLSTDGYTALFAEVVAGSGDLPSFWSTNIQVFEPARHGEASEKTP